MVYRLPYHTVPYRTIQIQVDTMFQTSVGKSGNGINLHLNIGYDTKMESKFRCSGDIIRYMFGET